MRPLSNNLASCSNKKRPAGDCGAVRRGFGVARTRPPLTHWEHCAVVEAAVPEMREQLRTLTVALARTHCGGKSLTDEQRAAAIAAFQSINTFDEHGKRTCRFFSAPSS
jgi:hypothetical protein